MKYILLVGVLSLIGNFSLAAEKKSVETQVIEVQVTENGFEPNLIEVKPDVPVTLKVTRKTDNTCATEIQMKKKKIKKSLPLNETVSVDLGKLKKGEHSFACGMDMIKGKIQVK